MEEKILRRKVKNREAAQNARDRKKLMVDEMEASLKKLTVDLNASKALVRQLKADNERIKKQNTILSSRLGACVCRTTNIPPQIIVSNANVPISQSSVQEECLVEEKECMVVEDLGDNIFSCEQISEFSSLEEQQEDSKVHNLTSHTVQDEQPIISTKTQQVSNVSNIVSCVPESSELLALSLQRKACTQVAMSLMLTTVMMLVSPINWLGQLLASHKKRHHNNSWQEKQKSWHQRTVFQKLVMSQETVKVRHKIFNLPAIVAS